MLGVHEDTLRNWDEQGLVVPDRLGTRKDRRYTAEHIKKIRDEGLVSTLARRGVKKKDYSKYTKGQLIKELHLLREQKKFGLVWEDKPEEVVEKCKTQAPILKPVSGMNVAGKKDEQKHMLIEGDNYHALEVLNYTHKGKIDVIYIDPPYNTGKVGEWKYNDKFVDENDRYRHSKWLSFMEKRLRAVKLLLSDKGVIFISIDDNEQANLKLLCDGILGESNFIGNFVWRKKVGAGSDSKLFFRQHEYIKLYAKNAFNLKELYQPLTEEQKQEYSNPDNDFRGPWAPTDLSSPAHDNDLRRIYEVTSPSGKVFKKCWSYKKENFDSLLEDDLIWWGKNNNTAPKRKRFLSEKKGLTPRSWIDMFLTYGGRKDLQKIGMEGLFDYPKPIDLVKHLMAIATQKKSIVLDFFAGSGTTGHAVMELNKEDGGNRQFILCTNNENNNGNGSKGIARGVCQPRIKKVMKGYKKNGDGEKIEGLGGSLEYLKTEFVDVENISIVSDKKKLEFTHQAGYTIALKEDTFTEVEKNDWYQIFTDEKDKFVGVYFREDLEKLEEFEKEILDKPEVKLYIFSYGGNDDWRNDYAEHENVSVESIPEPILRVYKSVNW